MTLPPRIDLKAVRERIGAYADKIASLEDRTDIYRELIGFVPPRIEARMAVTGALDPALLDMQEKMREHAMYPKCFDVKTAQLMLFGMLLMDLSDAAQLHAIAARQGRGQLGGDAGGGESVLSLSRPAGGQSRCRNPRQCCQARNRPGAGGLIWPLA